MEISKYGIILNTQHYNACVAFYRDVLQLRVLFEKDTKAEQLTCFDIGGAYLMVEPGGHATSGAKPVNLCPTKLRFNTPSFADTCQRLRKKGVVLDVRNYTWGDTAEFFDPDGNRCALRSEAGFAE